MVFQFQLHNMSTVFFTHITYEHFFIIFSMFILFSFFFCLFYFVKGIKLCWFWWLIYCSENCNTVFFTPLILILILLHVTCDTGWEVKFLIEKLLFTTYFFLFYFLLKQFSLLILFLVCQL